MKALAAISACAFLAAAAPAFATGAAMKHDLKANGSPDGAGYSHAGQAGAAGTEAGKPAKMTEGRASAQDAVINKNAAKSKAVGGQLRTHASSTAGLGSITK